MEFVHKKDKTLQFCPEYRKRNTVANRNAYPILRMDEIISLPGEATLLSTLDAGSEYYQTELDDADKDKTTFTSYHRLHRFVCMQFGLHDVPGTFQCTMVIIFSSMKWHFALVYLEKTVFSAKHCSNISIIYNEFYRYCTAQALH